MTIRFIMIEDRYVQILTDLFKKERLGVLATDMEGLPYTSLVAFAVTEDLEKLLFVTSKETRKYQNITNNPKVTILIDNRTNSPEDFHDAIAITAEGYVKEEPTQSDELKSIFIEKHPYLSEFVQSPANQVLVIKIKRYHYVNRFQNVRILELKK